ncbi:MAG TPA: hypothetical protein VG742_06965, partial [Dongiaceae bacterium]|nr:hypothetical protein [Dongiaceae bacterium]
MNRGKWGLFALSCGALLGCSDPFAFTISEVNEDAPQEPAYIALSSPQLYTRERLINDRRREVAYLKQVLKDSETAQFTPAIKRELQSVVAIAVALQAGFNPLAGAQAGRQESLAQLQQETLELEMQKRITILEAELAKLRSDQAAAADADSGVKVDPNTALSNPTDKANAQTVPTPMSPDKLKGLENALNALAAALTKADANTPGAQPA